MPILNAEQKKTLREYHQAVSVLVQQKPWIESLLHKSSVEPLNDDDPGKVIKVYQRDVYGVINTYPKCEQAELFACIAGTKTLTAQTINYIKQMGYSVMVVPQRDADIKSSETFL